MPGPELQRSALRRPLAFCPGCGSPRLEPVVEIDAEDVHFLCVDCTRCWHVELNYVHRMTPATCRGCRHLERCSAVYADDHPSA